MSSLSVAVAAFSIAFTCIAADAIKIGNRLEPFFDDFLIEKLEGGAALRLHRPEPKEVVLVTDKPWEGNTCAYYTIFQDGDKYRMYYRGSHWDVAAKKSTHPEMVCYAESTDGINWTKPELGQYEFNGSKQNNIVWNGIGGHNFAPFKDTNPDCAPEARYKALAHGRAVKKGDKKPSNGLYAFQSPDGLHWKLMSDRPVITEGAFDSQNLAFYDNVNNTYRDYHRWFNNRVRDIMLCTSKDFLTWTKPVGLKYTEKAREHLYTNAIQPYERAPHIFIGFPTRYLPNQGQRVEPTFMTSRDGLNFNRWPDAVIPEDAPKDRKGNRSNYMTRGLLKLPGNDREYSIYATEAYYTGPDSRVRRFTYRVDGFASASADAKGGTLVTKPVTFVGRELILNCRTGSKGQIRVELQDRDGKAIKGFALRDCRAISGDQIAQSVAWKGEANLQALSREPVSVVFELRDADLFSMQFR